MSSIKAPTLLVLLSIIFSISPVKATNSIAKLRTQLQGAKGEEQIVPSISLLSAYYLSMPDSATYFSDKADSLLELYPSPFHKADLLTEQAFLALVLGDLGKADSLGKEGFRLFKDQYAEGDTFFLKKFINSSRTNGIIHLYGVNFEQARSYMFAGLEANKELKDLDAEAALLNNIGSAYYRQSQADSAMHYLIKAIEISEVLGHKARIAAICETIGLIMSELQEFAQAKDYYQRAIIQYRQLGDSANLYIPINNIGLLFHDQAQYEQADSCLKRALAIAVDVGELDWQIGTLTNLGLNADYAEEKDSATYYYEQALLLSERSSLPDAALVASVNLGSLRIKKGEYRKALDLVKPVLPSVRELEMWHEIMVAEEVLARAYAGLGDYRQAYEYMQANTTSSEKYLNEEKIKESLGLERRYQNEKIKREKAEQDLIIQEQEQQNRLILIGFSAGILLLLLLAFMLGIRSRFRNRLKIQHLLAEQQKKRFSAVIEAEEQERSRIAKELHDGLGQLLSSARMNVSSLDEAVQQGGDKQDNEALDSSVKLIDEASKEVRHISHNLMPYALIEAGLVPALRQMANSLNVAQTDLLEVESNGYIGRLEAEQEISLYRIAQELVNNSLKHGGATNIKIRLEEDAFHLEDNGTGVTHHQLDQSSGIGWKNIQSRVEMLQGRIEVKSSRAGSHFHIRFS